MEKYNDEFRKKEWWHMSYIGKFTTTMTHEIYYNAASTDKLNGKMAVLFRPTKVGLTQQESCTCNSKRLFLTVLGADSSGSLPLKPLIVDDEKLVVASCWQSGYFKRGETIVHSFL